MFHETLSLEYMRQDHMDELSSLITLFLSPNTDSSQQCIIYCEMRWGKDLYDGAIVLCADKVTHVLYQGNPDSVLRSR